MEMIGWVSAICFTVSYLPQIWRTHKLKTVDDISIGLFSFTAVAYVTGACYGIWLDKYPLIYNYLAGLSLTSVIIFQWCVYKNPRKDEARKIVEKEVKRLMKELKERDDKK